MTEASITPVLEHSHFYVDGDYSLGQPGRSSIESTDTAAEIFCIKHGLTFSPDNSPWNIQPSDGIPFSTDYERFNAWLEVFHPELRNDENITGLMADRSTFYTPDLDIYSDIVPGLSKLVGLGLDPAWLWTGNTNTKGEDGSSVVDKKFGQLIKKGLVIVNPFTGEHGNKKTFVTVAHQMMRIDPANVGFHSIFYGDAIIDFGSWRIQEPVGDDLDTTFILRTPADQFQVLPINRYENGGFAYTSLGMNDALMHMGMISPYIDAFVPQNTTPGDIETFAGTIADTTKDLFNACAFKGQMLEMLGKALTEDVTTESSTWPDSKEMDLVERGLLLYYLGNFMSDKQSRASFINRYQAFRPTIENAKLRSD